MVRNVFFSFHYQNDVWPSNIVRNKGLTEGSTEAVGFFDAVDREEVKTRDSEEIKNWIDFQLEQTSVTVVLIGEETADRKFVRYEIQQSLRRGNGLLGLRIHNLRNENGETTEPGPNPLKEHVINCDDKWVSLANIFEVHDFVTEDGYKNLGNWIEQAAQRAEDLTATERQSIQYANDIPEVYDAEIIRKESSSTVQQTRDSNTDSVTGLITTGGILAGGIAAIRIGQEMSNGKSFSEAVEALTNDLKNELQNDS